MKDVPGESSSNIWHKLGVAVSGGVGGFFGIAAISVELPISTTIMLRSIADIARSEGESINSAQTKLACLEVFALGGESSADDGSENGYYAVRAALAQSVKEAVEYIAKGGAVEAGGPMLVRFIVEIANRFGIQVTEKAAAQAVPAIGAAGGALINTLFIDHFQDMARGHFIVRRLEKAPGKRRSKSCTQSYRSWLEFISLLIVASWSRLGLCEKGTIYFRGRAFCARLKIDLSPFRSPPHEYVIPENVSRKLELAYKREELRICHDELVLAQKLNQLRA